MSDVAAAASAHRGIFLKVLCFVLGTDNGPLAVRLGFALTGGLLVSAISVFLFDLPLLAFGILAGLLYVTVRTALPDALKQAEKMRQRPTAGRGPS